MGSILFMKALGDFFQEFHGERDEVLLVDDSSEDKMFLKECQPGKCKLFSLIKEAKKNET
jgi:hypothetical protein